MQMTSFERIMKRFVPLILLVLVFSLPAQVNGQGKPAIKDPCSSMTEAALHDIFDKIAPGGVSILSNRKSPVDGFCEIALGSKMNPQIVYLDYTKNFILAGSMFDAHSMTNLSLISKNAIQDQFRVDVAKIPLDNALWMGNAKATKKVIVFTDPDCPFCSSLHKTLHQIVNERQDVAFLIKLLPLPMHKDAYWKSKSILCNRSLKMLDEVFEKKEIPRTDCTMDELEKNLQFAQSFDFGTPTLIFQDGSVIPGAVPKDELMKKLDSKK
ncbi:MAG TPA: DsbC family protein [Syntrophales bacterium]|nr:DsbC family protein [Syntrophales bacterium]